MAKIFLKKKSTEWGGNFVCCSNLPVKWVDMFRKHKFCFIKKESGACKSHLLQSAAGTLWSSIPEYGLFDEFVSCEISQVTSSLYFSTWLLIRETWESILKPRDLILESFEIQERSLENQDASDCQLTFAGYCMLLLYPACFISFSLTELCILYALFMIKIWGHITILGDLTKILANTQVTLVLGDITSGEILQLCW